MGNFQHLADQILTRNSAVPVSFQFPPLSGETGNFAPSNGNYAGNSCNLHYAKPHVLPEDGMETINETRKKLIFKPEETVTPEKMTKSFPQKNSGELLIRFFQKVAGLGIDLLHEDRVWIQNILYGIPMATAYALLQQYVRVWLKVAQDEPIEQKRQNKGRYQANTFLRESLAQTKRI